MKNILNKIKLHLKSFRVFIILMKRLKFNFIPWIFLKSGAEYSLNMDGDELVLRKGSTDYEVARSTKKEFNILKHSLPQDYSGVIIDAGGYIGTAAIAFSKLYPNAIVVCVEASSDNFKILKKNCRKYSSIIPLNNALSALSGETINLSDRKTGNWGFTTVESPKDNPNAKFKEKIKTISINDIQHKYGKSELIKLDIEGAEKEILNTDLALRGIKIIMIELHDRINPGCSEAFFNFSRNRTILKDTGEKYISIS